MRQLSGARRPCSLVVLLTFSTRGHEASRKKIMSDVEQQSEQDVCVQAELGATGAAFRSAGFSLNFMSILFNTEIIETFISENLQPRDRRDRTLSPRHFHHFCC